MNSEKKLQVCLSFLYSSPSVASQKRVSTEQSKQQVMVHWTELCASTFYQHVGSLGSFDYLGDCRIVTWDSQTTCVFALPGPARPVFSLNALCFETAIFVLCVLVPLMLFLTLTVATIRRLHGVWGARPSFIKVDNKVQLPRAAAAMCEEHHKTGNTNLLFTGGVSQKHWNVAPTSLRQTGSLQTVETDGNQSGRSLIWWLNALTASKKHDSCFSWHNMTDGSKTRLEIATFSHFFFFFMVKILIA